jgi:hypothetical protein
MFPAVLLLVLAGCSASSRGDRPASSPGSSPPRNPAGEPVTVSAWWSSAPGLDRWNPAAALLLPTGDLVVADRIQNRLFRLTGASAPPIRLPSPGTTPVEWTALSIAPGISFYALDGPGKKIHQYDWQGNYLGEAFDLDRAADEQGLGSIDPAGLAVTRAGLAVVTDRVGDRLLAFGPGWTFLGVWGQSGSAPGSWRRPGSVAVGEQAPFLVADEGNRRVVLLDELGNMITVRDLDETPRGTAVLGSGLYAISTHERIEILDRDLRVEGIRILPPGPGCDGAPYVTSAISGDPSRLFAGEGCSGRLAAIATAGG